jgi:hypothetical protein
VTLIAISMESVFSLDVKDFGLHQVRKGSSS